MPEKKSGRRTEGSVPEPADVERIVVSGQQHQEDLFATRLIEELDFRLGLDTTTLDLGIRAGRAIARGAVSDQDELDALEETISESGGIDHFDCQVRIAPNRREEDRDRARSVLEALESHAELAADAENIQVACVGKKVVLRGAVTSERLKVKAGLLALRHRDVQRVRNRLVVSGQKAS